MNKNSLGYSQNGLKTLFKCFRWQIYQLRSQVSLSKRHIIQDLLFSPQTFLTRFSPAGCTVCCNIMKMKLFSKMAMVDCPEIEPASLPYAARNGILYCAWNSKAPRVWLQLRHLEPRCYSTHAYFGTCAFPVKDHSWKHFVAWAQRQNYKWWFWQGCSKDQGF